MEETIEKAIQGGYKNIGQNYTIESGNVLRLYRSKDNATTSLLDKETLLLDHEFWQAFIKQLAHENKGIPVTRSGATFMQHDFIDFIANGGSIDEFFNQIISPECIVCGEKGHTTCDNFPI